MITQLFIICFFIYFINYPLRIEMFGVLIFIYLSYYQYLIKSAFENNKQFKMLNKYFQNYQSEEDEDYNPTKQEQAIYRQEHQKKKKTQIKKTTTHQLWLQLQQQYQTTLNNKKIKTQQQSKLDCLELANKILNNDSIKPDKRIIFAGKQFILNEDTGQLQIAQKIKTSLQIRQANEDGYQEDPQHLQRRKTQISYQYLNHVMRAIYNRSRKINSVGKSKLDWKGFVKQQGIQDKLNYHRKGGVIQDMQFIKKKN